MVSDQGGEQPIRRGDRLALVVFCGQLVAAGILIRYLNRDQWFRYDEWEVLFNRSFTHPLTLFRNWNGHPVTFASVTYQTLYHLVGLHHYWPYQLLTILGHLGVAVGLRVLMRRMGVNPWLANASLAVLLVYGASQEDLAWGFSMVYVVPIALGLAQILLLDHDGPMDRRDAVAVITATLAIWGGPPGPVMAGAGLFVALARRGLRLALLQALPFIPFVGWVAFAPENAARIELHRATPGVALHYAARLSIDAVEGLGRFPVVSAGFGLAAAAGATLLLTPLRSSRWRQRPVAPLAVTASAVAVAVLIGVTRAAPTPRVPDPAVASRYLYLVAALLIPAMALAFDRLTRTSTLTLVIVIGALLLPLPRSINDVGPSNNLVIGFRRRTLTWAQVAARVPVQGAYQPYPFFSPGLRVSSLAEAHRTGRAENPPPGQEGLRATATLTLALKATGLNQTTNGCRRSSLLEPMRLERGDSLQVGDADMRIAQRVDGRSRGAFVLPAKSTWRVLWGPIEVIQRRGGASHLLVCNK